MNEERPLTKQDALQPMRDGYRAIEQLKRETEERVKSDQIAISQYDKALQVTSVFLKDIESVTEESLKDNSSILPNIYATGSMLFNSLRTPYGGVAGAISAGSATANVASMASEVISYKIGNFAQTEHVLKILNVPLRSNLESMSEAVRREVPPVFEFSNSISEDLQQTTNSYRYQNAAQKFRDFLSELGKQLSPEEDAKDLILDWVERHNGNLTQASRWKFSIYRYLVSYSYPTEIRNKCDALSRNLRINYEELSSIAHNRGDPISGAIAEPVINGTAINITEVLKLRRAAHFARAAMVEMELRKALPKNLRSDFADRPMSEICFEVPFPSSRSQELDLQIKFTQPDAIVKMRAKVALYESVQVELRVDDNFTELDAPS